ncbi:hypothetical protein B0I29_119170 [Actinoplanes lutulentus]|uniref:Uncharacterized protein n=1 Tax=Actinoplanes lutulentus TaxID=1287878 RepID=A0A327Z2J4_9ACTN|nr:hypothetical protein [Actinoplanes lutulentus]RAK28832.1 hypothetical protein B0I29_119170 [Actinoplanes lutulentus]
MFGPAGLGKLTIGMTVAQAKATGLITNYEGGSSPGCGASVLKASPDAGSVVHSPDLGVISIPAYGRLATPEGIRIGSTLKQVKSAYDDLLAGGVDDTLDSGNGRAWATGDDGDKVHYRFHFTDSKVAELFLEHDNQNCYE